MAFLCPVRIRRGKKKKDEDKISTRTPSIGRITGSASIETLVRVGIEKENGLSPDSKMVVLHEFTPCVDDELDVKRGQIVNVLYQENDWVYVIAENNQEGFIPHSYCAPVGSHLAEMALNVKHKKIPRTNSSELIDHLQGGSGMVNDPGGGTSDTSQIEIDIFSSSQNTPSDTHPFFKDPSGRYVVLYTFIARDENDVSVERGEYVTVLNKDDPDWYWIVRTDTQEGFVPSAFVCPIDNLIAQGQTSHHHQQQQQQQQVCKTLSNGNNYNNNNHNSINNNNNINEFNSVNELLSEDIEEHFQSVSPESEARFHGTELVMLYDYKAQAADDLSVRRGDWVYANLSNQTVDGWLWAYAPKIRKYGFIPKAYARPPAMTSL